MASSYGKRLMEDQSFKGSLDFTVPLILEQMAEADSIEFKVIGRQPGFPC